MNTDIICRWRDAITDPPAKNRPVQVQTFYGGQVEYWIGVYNGCHFLTLDGLLIYETDGDQWLDITTVPAVPRSKVQAAAKYTRDCQEMARGNDEYVAFGTAMDIIEEYTGVTPTEVHLEPCGQCGGTGRISYSPNLNPNAFPAVTTAKCGKCGGTGVTPSEETS